MKATSSQPGSIMLMVVILMSITILLCTRMWQSTAYIFDIALQKQLHVQHTWAAKGILNCGVAVCKKNFKALHTKVKERGGLLMIPITFNHDIPQFKAYSSHLVFEVIDDVNMHITAQLRNNISVVHSVECIVTKHELSHN